MAFFPQDWLHDFPDRAHRDLLLSTDNLGELLGQATPTMAAGLEVERARPLERELPLPDWRRRQLDLFFEVPYRDQVEGVPALVCVLIEHQSGPDQAMPLRMLLEVVLYWERRWKGWA